MAGLTALYQALTTEPGSLEISLPNADLCTFPRKVSAWFCLSPHSSRGTTGSFFPCPLALVGKQGKAAETLGQGGTPCITVWQQISSYHSQKGKRGHVMLPWQPKATEHKLQKAEPIKQPGVSNTLGPPGTGPSSMRGKVSIKALGDEREAGGNSQWLVIMDSQLRNLGTEINSQSSLYWERNQKSESTWSRFCCQWMSKPEPPPYGL